MKTGRILIAMSAYVLFGWLAGAGAYGDEPQGESDSSSLFNAKVMATLSVPDGFEVECVAAPPLVEYPTLACFDDRGRLFVGESAGLNLKKEQAEEQLTRSIRMLEDTDGDGRFDRSTVFADKMTFPMGGQWHDGALYVASPPNIWRLEDTDGDGKADRRDVVVGNVGWAGAGDVMKGPFRGPDGRFYFSGGLHGTELKSSDGKSQFNSEKPAPCIFSCGMDGRDLRFHAFAAIGLYNLAFSPEGDVFGTVTILRYPRGDGILHWIHGGQYSCPHHEAPAWSRSTGRLMPVMHEWGQTAPSGMIRYRSDEFGDDFRDNLLTAQFNTHKVTRSEIVREGSTFRAVDHEDLLVSTNPDFHPSDVLQDADGSLLVIDTGGWYVYNCPISKIAKPSIRGAIYRIRRTGSHQQEDPRGLKIDWQQQTASQCAGLLDDRRSVVRDRAINTLVGMRDRSIENGRSHTRQSEDADSRSHARQSVGELRRLRSGDHSYSYVQSIAALNGILKSSTSEQARRNAVWTLCRIATPAASASLRSALSDKSASVRQAAVHSVGVLRDEKALPQLTQIVTSDDPPVRREAATSLGLIGASDAVPALLAALRAPSDHVMQHAVTYALIEIGDTQATRAGLADAAPQVRRSALIALDQMDNGDLQRDEVTRLFDTGDLDLQRAALDVINRRTTWSAEIVGLLEQWLAEKNLPTDRMAALRGSLLAFAGDKAVQKIVANVLSDAKTPAATRLVLLDVIAGCELNELPPVWKEPLASALTGDDPRVVQRTISAIESLGGDAFRDDLRRLSAATDHTLVVRTAAAAVAMRNGQSMDDATYRLLATQSGSDVNPAQRLIAARGLADARLSEDQLAGLTPLIASAGPLELPSLMRAFAAGRSSDIGLKFVAALTTAPGFANASERSLRDALKPYPENVHTAAAELFRRLNIDEKAQAATLSALAEVLHGGDPKRGRNIFFGQRAACSACHRVADQGERIGPDLTRIAEIRRPRDLLESIVFPSATIAQGFQTMNVLTESGRVHSGIIHRQTGDAIYLRSADRAVTRIAQSEIDELLPGRVSIMPKGLDKTLTETQLRDLLAYLSQLTGGKIDVSIRVPSTRKNR